MHNSIIPISAFNDNYIWLYCNPTNKTCFVVDPGDAKPVFEALSQLGVTLTEANLRFALTVEPDN